MLYTTSGCRNRRGGAIAAQAALCGTVFLGLLAISLDGGTLLLERRHTQVTADAAALAAGAMLSQNVSTDQGLDPNGTAAARAQALVVANGFASSVVTTAKDASGNTLKDAS